MKFKSTEFQNKMKKVVDKIKIICYNTYVNNKKYILRKLRYQIMAEKKITKKMVVEMMLADEKIVANEVFKAYLENELELLKKKSENKKATKNQEANVAIKADILEVMANMAPSTATEIMNAVKSIDTEKYVTLTNQRVSALLRQLIEDNKVVKSVDKKVSKFALAD